MTNNEGSWQQWCKHVLCELERLDGEVKAARAKALSAHILALLVQAQLMIGAIALGYTIRVLVEHLTKG